MGYSRRGLAGLPTDWRGIPVRPGMTGVWVGHAQGFGSAADRFSMQGSNLPMEGQTGGMKLGGCYRVHGTMYHDTRAGREGKPVVLVVASYVEGSATDFLTDASGRPSGITRCGALAAGHEATQVQDRRSDAAYEEAIAAGQTPIEAATGARTQAVATVDVGTTQKAAQAYLDKLAEGGYEIGTDAIVEATREFQEVNEYTGTPVMPDEIIEGRAAPTGVPRGTFELPTDPLPGYRGPYVPSEEVAGTPFGGNAPSGIIPWGLTPEGLAGDLEALGIPPWALLAGVGAAAYLLTRKKKRGRK